MFRIPNNKNNKEECIMRKKKKIKTVIVEKFKYDDDDYGINLEPSLLLKLLEYAHEEASSDEQLHAVVARAHLLSHNEDCLEMEDYYKLIGEPTIIEIPVEIEVPAEEASTEVTPA